jgi:hypothetical protein
MAPISQFDFEVPITHEALAGVAKTHKALKEEPVHTMPSLRNVNFSKSKKEERSSASASVADEPTSTMTATQEMETAQEGVSTSSPSARPRVQVDFSQDAYKRLQEIKAISGEKTNVDVIRNALRLYGWYLEKKSENYQLLLAKDEQVKQVELIL